MTELVAVATQSSDLCFALVCPFMSVLAKEADKPLIYRYSESNSEIKDDFAALLSCLVSAAAGLYNGSHT